MVKMQNLKDEFEVCDHFESLTLGIRTGGGG